MSRWIRLATLLLTLQLLAAPAWAAEHDAHAAGHEETPQLIKFPPRAPEVLTAVTTVAIFGLLVVILGKFAWGPIVSGLKKREDQIRKDIADAEATRVKAEAALKDYNTQLASAETRVREMLTKATADGEKISAQIHARAQQEAEDLRQRATREIEAAKKQALAEIYEQAADLSTRIAEKILGRNLNPADQVNLVRSSLDQLQSLNRG